MAIEEGDKPIGESACNGAMALIDEVLAQDPNQILVDSQPQPVALHQGRRATYWVRRLDPSADVAQLLAARAHHFQRWMFPRSDYPEGRAGYLQWRANAKRAHAEAIAEVLASAAVAAPVIARVQQLLRKENLRGDVQVQTHEDALCCVFLETQLDDLIERLGDDHMIKVLQKTAAKMSPAGLAAAGSVSLSLHGQALLQKALT